VLNICDDEPAPVRDWLPGLAQAIGAKPPRRVPRFVGRLLGPHVIQLMCEARGASNARAKALLDWTPSVPTWREGFAQLNSLS
jgi:2-alkyl-3-oxoalkanoate reductase